MSESKIEKVSVVVPLLNEQESLPELTDRIEASLTKAGYAFEVIFVDDGSTDDSWKTIASLQQSKTFVKGVRLRRNYGKSAALQEGFELATGNYICTMDADLQDDPDELPEMIQMLKDGLDLVSGWKQKRYDPISKTIPSKFFNFVTSQAAGIELHDFNCGLKAYKAEVIHSIRLYGELHRYIPLLAKWEGFSKIGEKVVQHHARKYGYSKFGLSRFVKGFLDLVSILFVQRYLQRPMHFFGTLGTVSLLTGSGIVGWLVFARIFLNQFLSNRPLLIIGVLFMVLGVQFFSVGLIGELIIKKNGPERAHVKEII
ncbi:glycosyltransferase [bacterium]|nr:MAG: glycosyltransferase [bacterium]